MTINIDQHLQVGDKYEVEKVKFLNGDLSMETAEVFVPEEILTRVGEILDKHTDRGIHNFYVMQAWDEMIQFANEYNISKRKLLFILARLSEKYFEQTRQLVDSFADEMSSEALVQVAGEIMWRPDVAEEFKTTLIGVVKYKHAFDEIYEQELLQAVDFSQPSEVFKISAWLDFLRRLHANAYFDTAKEKSADIQKTLTQKYEASGDNTIYFLDLQIRDVLQQMDSGLAELDLNRDRFPFEVSRGLYGIHKNGQLYVANLEDSKGALDIVKRIEMLEKSAGSDRGLINGLYSEMMSMFDKSIDIQRPAGISEEEWKKEYFNYSCLMRKPIREAIKADFGFSLEELSVREQFYFLNYAKHYSVKDVKRLQEFTKQYGVQGARTFLSLEHGGLEMGEVILRIGEQLKHNPEVADKVFAQYLEMANGVETEVSDLVEVYNDIFFDKQIDKDRARQAMLRKANLILRESLKNLQGVSDNQKAVIIDELIADLKRQIRVEKQAVEHLRYLAKKLNDLYKQIDNQIIGKDSVEKLRMTRESNFGGIDEKYLKKIDDDYDKYQKYDSKRIREDIAFFKRSYTLSAEKEKELRKTLGMTDEQIENIHIHNEEERKRYEPQVAKLEKLLKLQEKLEEALEEYIYGQKVELGNIDSSDASNRVIERYQELVEEAKKSRDELRSLFRDEVKLADEDLSRIADNILEEARQVLDDYVTNAVNDKEGIDKREALNVLERASVKIKVLSSILKLIKRDGDYGSGLEIIKDLDVEFKDLGSDFDKDEEKSKIIKNLIIKQAIVGRQKEGESIQRVKEQAGVIDTAEALEDIRNIRTYILKYKGDIIGFAYFQPTYIDENGNQHYYASGLNILKDVQGLNVGANFMEVILMTEAQKPKQIIDALTSIDKKVTSHYIEKLPFVVSGFKDDYKDNKPRFSITINLEELGQLKTKIMSQELIKQNAQEMHFVEIIKKMNNREGIIFVKYDMTNKSEGDFINQIKNTLPNKNAKKERQNINIQNYYITRYFDDTDNGIRYRYVVFERRE